MIEQIMDIILNRSTIEKLKKKYSKLENKKEILDYIQTQGGNLDCSSHNKTCLIYKFDNTPIFRIEYTNNKSYIYLDIVTFSEKKDIFPLLGIGLGKIILSSFIDSIKKVNKYSYIDLKASPNMVMQEKLWTSKNRDDLVKFYESVGFKSNDSHKYTMRLKLK